MKRTFQLLALVAISSAMMVSCKNNKQSEPTPEEIQAQKVALADSVLAQIDAFANELIIASENSFHTPSFELSEEEKMVKPDYLLDPSFASTLVTKSQKVNALAYYLADLPVRMMYDIPLEETKEIIAKLAVELNHPIDADFAFNYEILISEKIKKEYEACKERGDLAYFWQFHYAYLSEMSYILANNQELFFSKITNEQWMAYNSRFITVRNAIEELAEYDEEMALLLEIRNKYQPYASAEEMESAAQSIEAAKHYRIAKKDKYIARRNALLQ